MVPLTQCFSTFEIVLSLWRNLDIHKSPNLIILTKPNEKRTEPLGSTDPTATLKKHCSKAALRLSFYACVYCMQLSFQSNYLGLSQPI
jgi:hypothetical protein